MPQENTSINDLEILKEQEERFQFEHFTNEDIWKLGKWMTEEAMRKALPIAISIRLFSGVTAFQYFCSGSKLNNETWMKRKELTVREMEMSSLRMCVEFEGAGKSMEDKLMDRYAYACCGGGFPVRIRNVGVIGSIIVSGLPHKEDHAFIIQCLESFFQSENLL